MTKPTVNTPTFPPAVLSKTAPSLDHVAALRILPIKREHAPSNSSSQTPDINKHIQEFVE